MCYTGVGVEVAIISVTASHQAGIGVVDSIFISSSSKSTLLKSNDLLILDIERYAEVVDLQVGTDMIIALLRQCLNVVKVVKFIGVLYRICCDNVTSRC